MDSTVVRAALGEIEREMERAQEARSQLEAETFGYRHSGGWEEPGAVLPHLLNRVYDMLLVVLECAGLPETRARLIEKWLEFESAGGIGEVKPQPQYDYVESKPLTHLETLIAGLRSSVGVPMDSSDTSELLRLDTLLRKTAVLVHKRGITPQGELDVQNVKHDYLEACFPHYRHPIEIAGIIRNFKPDGGVRNLKAAIEFKFATTRAEVAGALSGIFEDVSGYSGSLDWTRFFSVVYQTGPYESEDRFRAEMARVAGGLSWTPIVVTGGGARRPKSAGKPVMPESEAAAARRG